MDFLISSGRIARGIRNLSRRVSTSTTNIHDPFAVVGELQFGYFLAGVFVVLGQLARFGDIDLSSPDIAFTLLIEGPGNAFTGRCGNEIGWEGRTENLFDCEAVIMCSLSGVMSRV